jgi:serpin B
MRSHHVRIFIAFLVALSLDRGIAMASPPQLDTAGIVKRNSAFAVDLFHRLRDKEGNLFLSPYSISTALALTSAGARGKTAEEMAAVLHFPAVGEVHPALAALMHEVNSGGAKKGYRLYSSNGLWGATGYAFRPEFLKVAKDDYGADLTNLDFATDADGARRTINARVEQDTQNKIRDLIAPGVLMPVTRLVLTNAIYFKGNWEQPFSKNRTKEETFRTAGGAKPKVPLMNRTARFGYSEWQDLQALELPYTGKELCLLVLLPKNDNLAGLEKTLTPDRIADISAKLSRQEVIVHLPRFKTTAEFELSKPLKDMGMSLAFSDRADFSGMTSSSEALMLSKVLHKAFVEINEEGTEAAAATAVIATPTAAPARPKAIPVFRADHPFIYLIRDTRNGSILFLGRLADPTR